MIKVGILGTGFGLYHLELYKKIEGFEVTHIYGRDVAKLDEIGKTHNVITTTDINEIISNPFIDIIDICLPTHLHAQYTIAALEHDKHVFCETPLTYNLTDAEHILQMSLKSNKHVFVDLFYKFSSPHHTAIQMIKDNQIGQIRSFTSYNKTAPTWGNLGLEKNISDFHIHNIDFLLETLGLPSRVTSNGMDFGEQSTVVTTLNYDHSFAVISSYSNLLPHSPFLVGFEIIGEFGCLTYDAEYGERTKESFTLRTKNGTVTTLTPPIVDDYEQVIMHLKECILQIKSSEYIDITSAISSLRVIKAIEQSISSKQSILFS